MGTFAELIKKDGTGIPEEKREEFRNRVEKLFQAGGMMELEHIQLCGKKAALLTKAVIHGYGMDFCYNYFEDDFWENAGFNLKGGYVWSNKIGWREFHRAVVAAYVLEGLYTDGSAAVLVNGEPVVSPLYTGWINYVLQEQYAVKNNDPWTLFEAFHDQKRLDSEDLEKFDWSEFVQDMRGLVGYYEVLAVLMGTAAADLEFYDLIGGDGESGEDGKVNFFVFIDRLRTAVRRYHEESGLSETEQPSQIMEMLRLYYEQESVSLSASRKYEDKNLEAVRLFTALANAPAYTVKLTAETYGLDFWELWGQLKAVAKRGSGLYPQEIPRKVPPVSTMDFFKLTSDDMILFWDGNEEIHFSDELKRWFVELRCRYDELLEADAGVESPLDWILDLMQYADENYYRIYTFSDFFKETVAHLNDRRFLALWGIYDEMLHDPEMEEAGSVVFVPEGPESENIGLYYPGEAPRRRLRTYWDIMPGADRNNRARVTFRRYMALLENRKLRKEIFGF